MSSYTVTLQASASTVRGGEWVNLQATCAPALSSGDTLQILGPNNAPLGAAESGTVALLQNQTMTPTTTTSVAYTAEVWDSNGNVLGQSNSVTVTWMNSADGTNNGHQNVFGSTAALVNFPTASIAPGSTVTITASGTGFNNPLYQFWWLPPGGSWTSDPNGYTASNTYNLYVLAEGDWQVTCYAVESSAPQYAYPYLAKADTQTLYVNSVEKVSLSAPGTALVNQTVTLTATATNITNPVYQFWWQNPQTGAWSSTGFLTSNTHSFAPTARGPWRCIVYAQPAGSTFP